MGETKNCLFCNGVVSADAEICPHCGGPVKSVASPVGGKSAPAGANPLLCPSCAAPVRAGDIVCTKCGTNLLTGQKVVQVQQEAAPKKQIPWGMLLKYAGLTAMIAMLIVALGLLAFVLLNDPVSKARQLARTGNLTEATEVLQRYLESKPADGNAHFLLGQIHWQAQQYDRASEAFEASARQGGPLDRDAALLSILAGERTSGDRNRDRQLAFLQTLIQQRYPTDVELLKATALLYGMNKAYREQQSALDEAVSLGGELAPVLPGMARALNGDLDGAEQQLQGALDKAPESAEVAAALGLVSKMRGQAEAAVAALEKAQTLEGPAGALITLQLGALHMQQRRYGKALSLLNKAKTGLPDDLRAQFLHALCLQENKLLDEALVAYEKLVSGTHAYTGLAALQMAIIYSEQGNFERAAALARQAGEAGLNTARQATIQGRIFALQGDLSQAEQSYQRAISMMADYPAARLELGLLLVNRGAVDQGLTELDAYLELARKDPARYRANEIEVLVSQLRQAGQK